MKTSESTAKTTCTEPRYLQLCEQAPKTARERILAAARLVAQHGAPLTRPATDDELCILFGWTPEELEAERALYRAQAAAR